MKSIVLKFCVVGLLGAFIACDDDEPPPVDAEVDAACPLGAAGCPCLPDAGCDEGQVCDRVSGVCRSPVGCEFLDCAPNQVCTPANDLADAVCEAECVAGFEWVDKQCAAVPPNCDADRDNSMVATCAAQQRECAQDPELGARCGGCLDGLVAAAGVCRSPVTCDALDCAALGRPCMNEGGDASCGPCSEGTRETTPGGLCAMLRCGVPGVPSDFDAECAALGRVCAMTPEGARCDACVAGRVEDDGVCRTPLTCADLGCAASGRTCGVEGGDARCGPCRAGFDVDDDRCVPTPGGHCAPEPAETSIAERCAAEGRSCVDDACGPCLADFNAVDERCEAVPSCDACMTVGRLCAARGCGGCADGFVEDANTGDCRPPRGCDETPCPPELACVANDSADATCRPDCGDGAVFNGLRCTPCPACDAEGETGVSDRLTLAGACICDTEPGYYFSVAEDIGAFPCDVDGDGWVRTSARAWVESDDPALAASARCDVRVIEAVDLVNEADEVITVQLDGPVALYESDRNDDDVRLAMDLPATFGEGGRQPTAVELNRFVRYCNTTTVDYNGNGTADVDDRAGQPLLPGARAEDVIFDRFSYFGELHQGRFEANAEPNRGRWVIQERSRIALPDDAPLEARAGAVALLHDAPTETWRTCGRRRDAQFVDFPEGAGFDLGMFSPGGPTGPGMFHHSQFKCLVITSTPDPLRPQQISLAAATRDFALNRCGPVGVPSLEERNPANAAFECALVDTAQPGDVVWGVTRYTDYNHRPPGDDYVQGCVDECVEALINVCGFDPADPLAVDCQSDEADFGRFEQCTALEICDGADNDVDGDVDESFPSDGFDCDSGFSGACAAGVLRCVNGVETCNALIMPGLNLTEICGDRIDNDCDGVVDNGPVEVCDGADNDCNGAVDDRPTDVGGQCRAPDLPGGARPRGDCAQGTFECRGGERLCVGRTPGREVCGGGDENCDGETNEAGAMGCTVFHMDADGDGFGDPAIFECRCAPGDGFVIPEAELGVGDCCDNNDDVRPNQGGLFGEVAPGCNVGFDYNCNGNDDVEFSDGNTAPGCGVDFPLLQCRRPAVGWLNAVPACGTRNPFYQISAGNTCLGGAACIQETDLNRLQRCR